MVLSDYSYVSESSSFTGCEECWLGMGQFSLYHTNPYWNKHVRLGREPTVAVHKSKVCYQGIGSLAGSCCSLHLPRFQIADSGRMPLSDQDRTIAKHEKLRQFKLSASVALNERSWGNPDSANRVLPVVPPAVLIVTCSP